MWGVWLACITYSHYTYGIEKQATPADSTSNTQLWKVCSVLYTLSLFHSFLVTGLFWGLLYPTIPIETIYFHDIYKHSQPLFCLLIEFALNNLVIEWRHWAPNMVFVVLYMLVNIGYSTTGDRYVYAIIPFNNAESWYLLVAILAAVPIVFALLWYFDTLKYTLVESTVSSQAFPKESKALISNERKEKDGDNEAVVLVLLE